MKQIFSHLLVIAITLASLATVSCSGSSKEDPKKPDPTPQGREQYFDGTYYHDLPTAGWETEVMDRANLLLQTQWTPLAAVPKYSSGSYTQGTTYTGMPYSGVSSTYGIVGQQVSMYTFLSAVANPKSQMYTTDYRDQGSTPACYYGTVCSTAVFFAWGFPVFRNTVHVDDCEYLTRKASTKIEDLELLDGMNYYNASTGGHLMLITDVARDKDGKLCKVTVWESQSPVVHVTTYTPAELQARFDRFGAPVYFYQVKPKYKRLKQPDFMEQKPVSGYTFPKDLMTNRGDKVSYAPGQEVVINILSSGYKSLELYKDDVLNKTIALNGTNDVKITDLVTGLYKARLVADGKGSDYTYFEIGNDYYTKSRSGNKLTIKCDSKIDVPQYVTMNDGLGGEMRLLEKESDGVWTHEGDFGSATTVRVHFAGKYGTYAGLAATL